MTVNVIVIAGPTACGKTGLAVDAAHRFGSQILSADSRQVYRRLDIGTGKDLHEYSRVDPPVPYHLIDIVDPEDVYTLFRFQRDCYGVFERLSRDSPIADGTTPLFLVGGTGLYLEAVIRDHRLADVPVDKKLRRSLEGRTLDQLARRLQRDAPEVAARTDLTSSRRVIRVIEIAEFQKEASVEFSPSPAVPLRFTVLCVDIERELLRRRIGARLRQRIEQGMIDEVRSLLEEGLPPRRLAELGLEYREVAAYLLQRVVGEGPLVD